MARNPLAPPLTTAAVIAELRLGEADVSPEVRRAAALAAARAMTPAERAAVAERNKMLSDSAAIKILTSKIDMYGPPRPAEQRSAGYPPAPGIPSACPRCGEESRKHDDNARIEWHISHGNARHGGAS